MNFKEVRDLAVEIFCNNIKSEKISPISKTRALDFFSVKYSKEDIYPLNLDVFYKALLSPVNY